MTWVKRAGSRSRMIGEAGLGSRIPETSTLVTPSDP